MMDTCRVLRLVQIFLPPGLHRYLCCKEEYNVNRDVPNYMYS